MSDLTQRRKEQAEALMRNGICEAVTAVLIDVGLGGLTMDRVADAAGVSKGTLYNYFRDKNALLLEVVDRAFTPLQRDMERIAAEGGSDHHATLVSMAHVMLSGIEERRGLAAVLKEGELTEAVKIELGRRMANAERLFTDVIVSAANAGLLHPCFAAPQTAGRLLFLSLHGIVDYRIEYPEACPPLNDELTAIESQFIPLWLKETP